jgi:hypothetical protein
VPGILEVLRIRWELRGIDVGGRVAAVAYQGRTGALDVACQS